MLIGYLEWLVDDIFKQLEKVLFLQQLAASEHDEQLEISRSIS